MSTFLLIFKHLGNIASLQPISYVRLKSGYHVWSLGKALPWCSYLGYIANQPSRNHLGIARSSPRFAPNAPFDPGIPGHSRRNWMSCKIVNSSLNVAQIILLCNIVTLPQNACRWRNWKHHRVIFIYAFDIQMPICLKYIAWLSKVLRDCYLTLCGDLDEWTNEL